MEKKYEVKKINVCYSGAGWQSKSDMREEWAIVIEPFGVTVKTFKTEAEAVDFFNNKYGKAETA